MIKIFFFLNVHKKIKTHDKMLKVKIFTSTIFLIEACATVKILGIAPKGPIKHMIKTVNIKPGHLPIFEKNEV